jgi:hypothetical protein
LSASSASATEIKRDAYLRRTYGITAETYARMLLVHDGSCWICRRPPKPGKNLNVDHLHDKANPKVRGLLCFFCNKYLIGRRKQHHAYMYRNAAEYLESPQDWRQNV